MEEEWNNPARQASDKPTRFGCFRPKVLTQDTLHLVFGQGSVER